MSPRLRRRAFTLWLLLAGSVAAWPQSSPAVRLAVGSMTIGVGRLYLFPDVAVGAESSPVTFTLTNAGGSALVLGRDAVAISGGAGAMFAVVGQPERALPAGGRALFRMVFAPKQAGPFVASVSIGPAGRPPLFSFRVAGNGIPSE